MDLAERIGRMEGLRALVVGDVVLDRYWLAEPARLSREAPVLVLRHRGERHEAGGAGNVARNLAALGARVVLIGAGGADAEREALEARVRAGGVEGTRLRRVEGYATPLKTRVLAAEPRRYPHQVLRVDREPEGALPARVRAALADEARAAAREADLVLVSDYGYGAVGPELGALASEWAAQGVPVVLDPRREIDSFRGLAALTPNVGELARFTGREPERLEEEAELWAAAGELRSRTGAQRLLVTCGNRGMRLVEPDGVFSVEASGSGEVTDVCGAGDTASAVFALALAAGAEASEAMGLANAASGVVVQETGAAVCPPAALRAALADAPPVVRCSEGPR